MKLRAISLSLSLLVALPAALAQSNDRLAYVNLSLEGSANGTNYNIYTVTPDAAPHYLVQETGTASNNVSAIVRQAPGNIQTIGIEEGGGTPSGADQGEFDIVIKAPPGFTVLVDTDDDGYPDTPSTQQTGNTTFSITGPKTYAYQVVENRSLSATVAGQLTRLDVGDLVFELGLGSMDNGKSAGRLQLRHNGKTGASTYGLPSSLFAFGQIQYVGPHLTGLTWSSITSGRKLESDQMKVEVVNSDTDEVTVSFYAGNGSTGYEGAAFATYVLLKATSGLPANAPSSSDCLKITETQGSVTVVHWVFRSTAGDIWTLIQGTSGEQRIEEHASTVVGSDREETITVKNSGLTTVTKRRLTWAPLNYGEMLIKDEVWSNPEGSVDLTTTHEYYGTSGGVDKGDRGLLKKTTYPNGAEVEYDYYDSDDRLGQIETVTEPWSNGSSIYDKVTTYDYDGPTGLFKNYLKSEIVTINITTVAKTTHDYSFSSTDYTRTTKHYADASNYLTTTTKAYRSDADYFLSDRPLKIEYPDGRQQSFTYEEGTNGDSKTWIIEGSHVSGSTTTSATVNSTSVSFESIKLVTNKSTVTEIIRNADDNVTSEKVFVWSGSSFDTTAVVSNSTTWLDGVRRDYRTAVNGAVQDWTWQGAYLASTTDGTGIEHTFAYDSVGRLYTDTKTAVSPSGYDAQGAITTTYAYFAYNLQKSATVAGGSDSRKTAYTYDGAGRATSSSLPDGRTMLAAYAFDGSAPKTLKVTETLSCGGTVETYTLPDGKVRKVLSSGVDRFYSYSLDSGGKLTSNVRFGTDAQTRYEQTVSDWLGRSLTITRPGPPSQSDVVETMTYDTTTGLLTKIEHSNGLATEYRTYDEMGRLNRTGLDVDTTAGISTTSASDRIMDIETEFAKIGSDWWVSTEQKIYATASSGTATSLGITRRQLSGLSTGGAKLEQVDRFGQVSSTDSSVYTTDRKVTTTTTFPGLSNTAQTIAINGNLVYQASPDGRSVEYIYDSLGRHWKADDSRNGITEYTYDEVYANSVYNDTDRVAYVTDPKGVTVATYGYDAGGRVDELQTPSGTRYYDYDCAGRLAAQWGANQPAAYHYNTYGEMDGMRTFRSGDYSSTQPTYSGGDLTTWSYHAGSGLLEYKEDAATNRVNYTYNARGLVSTRQWARVNGSSQRVTTTYSYADKLADLTGKTYTNDDDLTPDVSLSYTRGGLPYQAGDASLGTSTFAYNAYLDLDTETLPSSFYGSRVMKRQYDSYHRPKGFKLGNSGDDDADLTQTHTYSSSTGLLASIDTQQAALTSRSFSYSYVSGSSMLDKLSTGSGGTLFELDRDYETVSSATPRDLVATIEARYAGGAAITRHDYTYNNARQRESAKQSGSAFADYDGQTFYRYTYNSRGELTRATGYMGADVSSLTVPMSGRDFLFGYDNMGNRDDASETGSTSTELISDYTPDSLNRITERDRPYASMSGTVDSAALVVVDGVLAGQQGGHWSGPAVLSNSGGPALETIRVRAVDTTPSPDIVDSENKQVLLAEDPETMTYDADGNLTEDGLWSYTYDAENRLVDMTSTLPTTGAFTSPADYDRYHLEFAYDYVGRRVRKKVTNAKDSSVTIRRYLYDGWNLVAEFEEASSAIGDLKRSYTWGLDIAGTLHGTGGVGALVQMSVHDSSTVTDYYPTYDGNGNVSALVKSNGTLAAAYEYGPFGEMVRAQELDSLVVGNPFRFSSKFTDVETGLVYYGHRYYNPSLGRFINRDPIEEQGGINLYSFVGNNPVNAYDYLGNNVILSHILFEADEPAYNSSQENITGMYDSFANMVSNYATQTAFNASVGVYEEQQRRDSVSNTIDSALGAVEKGIISGEEAAKIIQDAAAKAGVALNGQATAAALGNSMTVAGIAGIVDPNAGGITWNSTTAGGQPLQVASFGTAQSGLAADHPVVFAGHFVVGAIIAAPIVAEVVNGVSAFATYAATGGGATTVQSGATFVVSPLGSGLAGAVTIEQGAAATGVLALRAAAWGTPLAVGAAASTLNNVAMNPPGSRVTPWNNMIHAAASAWNWVVDRVTNRNRSKPPADSPPSGE